MKKLRLFDSLKFVRLVVAVVAATLILNIAHADETCDTHWENYVSATGTVSQSGTPSPSNRIEPKFYTQGDMVLRAVGNVADSYDVGTGKITRRIGIKVFNGTESWTISSNYSGTYTTFWLYPDNIGAVSATASTKAPVISNYFSAAPASGANSSTQRDNTISTNSNGHSPNTTWIRTNDFQPCQSLNHGLRNDMRREIRWLCIIGWQHQWKKIGHRRSIVLNQSKLQRQNITRKVLRR